MHYGALLRFHFFSLNAHKIHFIACNYNSRHALFSLLPFCFAAAHTSLFLQLSRADRFFPMCNVHSWYYVRIIKRLGLDYSRCTMHIHSEISLYLSRRNGIHQCCQKNKTWQNEKKPSSASVECPSWEGSMRCIDVVIPLGTVFLSSSFPFVNHVKKGMEIIAINSNSIYQKHA